MNRLFVFLLGLGFSISIFSQPIDKIEFFLDVDPGFGRGSPIFVNEPTENIDLRFHIAASIIPGFHRLYVRAKAGNSWSLTQVRSLYAGRELLPQMLRLEYFIDTDPGFGQATSITLNSSGDEQEQIFLADLGNISQGPHQLYIRGFDNRSGWSLVMQRAFFAFSGPVQANISKLEYFFDTDPGFGQGINIPINQPQEVISDSYLIDLTDLEAGYHQLFIRAQSDAGAWSIVQHRGFFVNPLSTESKITSLHYYFSGETGTTQTYTYNIPQPSNLVDLVFEPNTSELLLGEDYSICVTAENLLGETSTERCYNFTFGTELPPFSFPTIALSSGSINAGGVVRIIGNDFTPQSGVRLIITDPLDNQSVKILTSNGQGEFTYELLTNLSMVAGIYRIEAVDEQRGLNTENKYFLLNVSQPFQTSYKNLKPCCIRCNLCKSRGLDTMDR